MHASFFASCGLDVVVDPTAESAYTVVRGSSVEAAIAALTAQGIRVERSRPGSVTVFVDGDVAHLTWPWTLADRARAAVLAELVFRGELPAPAGVDSSTAMSSTRLLEVGLPAVTDEVFVSTAATLLADRLPGRDGTVAEFEVTAALYAEPSLFDLAHRLQRS
jgi:hypothetical protein